jgi:hypothetical protein
MLGCLRRRVRGVLFVDYVRMIRGQKRIDWSRWLQPEDLLLLEERIDLNAWYPMEVFERYGLGIIQAIAARQTEAARMWGRFQLEGVIRLQPTLIAEGDPRETLMRFQSLRRIFFDYDAIDVVEVLDDSASIAVQYGMSPAAEEPACHQTLGFCERLVEVAGASNVVATFTAESWRGAPTSLVALRWSK